MASYTEMQMVLLHFLNNVSRILGYFYAKSYSDPKIWLVFHDVII